MMQFLRSQSQTVLVIVLGVIGLGFLFYGNAGNLLTGSGGHVSSDYGRIDGQDLTFAELTGAIRNTRRTLAMEGRAQQLLDPRSHAAVAQEAWRQLLLSHEADQLHIQISDEELENYIRSLQVFQKNGAYSPEAYRGWLTHQQNVLDIPTDNTSDPIAATESIVETIMRTNLQNQAVNKALFSAVRTSPSEVSDTYGKYYGPTQVGVVTFDPKSFSTTVQVSPDEIETEYKSNPLNPAYRSKEKRKVDYVLFPLSPDQAKLTGDAKTAAMQTLGEKALDFAIAFQPDPSATATPPPPPAPDFVAEAKKRNLTPVTTDFFALDTPPATLPPSPAFNNAAFALTKDDTISKVVRLTDAVAVLHLAEIQPSELLPLDQVRADITRQLQELKGRQAMELAATDDAKALKAAVARGTDFKTAAAALNLKVETLTDFIPAKVGPDDAHLQMIGYALTLLSPGQVSDPVPVQKDNTLLVVHLDSRGTPDPAGLADFEGKFRQSQDEKLRTQAYIDWADWMSRQPGTHKPPELEAYGGAE